MKRLVYRFSAVLFAILLLVPSSINAQVYEEDDDSNNFMDRLVLGGGLGFGYSDGWNINVSPTVGYRLTPRSIVGIGVVYQQVSDKYFNDFKEIYNIYGGKVFAKQMIFSSLYGISEYERLSYSIKLKNPDGVLVSESGPFSNTKWLFGAGYSTNFYKGLGFSVEALYDVLWKNFESPSRSPWEIRGGLSYGF